MRPIGASPGPGNRQRKSALQGIASGADHVDLSPATAAFAAQRLETVEALAARYEAGEFRPDSQDTSRGMVDLALMAQ